MRRRISEPAAQDKAGAMLQLMAELGIRRHRQDLQKLTTPVQVAPVMARTATDVEAFCRNVVEHFDILRKHKDAAVLDNFVDELEIDNLDPAQRDALTFLMTLWKEEVISTDFPRSAAPTELASVDSPPIDLNALHWHDIAPQIYSEDELDNHSLAGSPATAATAGSSRMIDNELGMDRRRRAGRSSRRCDEAETALSEILMLHCGESSAWTIDNIGSASAAPGASLPGLSQTMSSDVISQVAARASRVANLRYSSCQVGPHLPITEAMWHEMTVSLRDIETVETSPCAGRETLLARLAAHKKSWDGAEDCCTSFPWTDVTDVDNRIVRQFDFLCDRYPQALTERRLLCRLALHQRGESDRRMRRCETNDRDRSVMTRRTVRTDQNMSRHQSEPLLYATHDHLRQSASEADVQVDLTSLLIIAERRFKEPRRLTVPSADIALLKAILSFDNMLAAQALRQVFHKVYQGLDVDVFVVNEVFSSFSNGIRLLPDGLIRCLADLDHISARLPRDGVLSDAYPQSLMRWCLKLRYLDAGLGTLFLDRKTSRSRFSEAMRLHVHGLVNLLSDTTRAHLLCCPAQDRVGVQSSDAIDSRLPHLQPPQDQSLHRLLIAIESCIDQIANQATDRELRHTAASMESDVGFAVRIMHAVDEYRDIDALTTKLLGNWLDSFKVMT